MRFLVYSNTSAPMVGYGFQDAEIKSGCVFYSSVLYWNATRLMAEMATATGDHKLATTMWGEAERVRNAATKILWNDELGVFMASTGLEKLNIDLWGNAMAGAKHAFLAFFLCPQNDPFCQDRLGTSII
jgi:hypothetical protein